MKLIKYIEMEEFKKILAVEKKKEFKLAYVLGMGSGLRISEIVGLKDELSRCHKAKVTSSNDVIDGKKRKVKHCSICGHTLTAKDLVLGKEWKIHPLTKEQVDLSKHQIKVFGKRGKERIAATSPWLTQTNIQMLPLNISRRTLEGRFKRLANKVLGRNLNFHMTRHGYANYMINVKKVPVPIVQGLLGHENLSTTGEYTKANPITAVQTVWESF
jgi:integrase